MSQNHMGKLGKDKQRYKGIYCIWVMDTLTLQNNSWELSGVQYDGWPHVPVSFAPLFITEKGQEPCPRHTQSREP
jgi:hypothetical protein